MDPLSVTASIIAVLQLSAKVLEYLNNVESAPRERAQCAIEASNLHSLLLNLRFRLEEGTSNQPWYNAVRALAVQNGPLDQFKQALEMLQTKVTDGGRLKKVGEALVWKFKKEEVTSILDRMERLKSLVNIALENDHFKLSQAIKEDSHFVRTHIPIITTEIATMRQDQDHARYVEIVNWISSSNYPAQQSDIIERRQEGTGQWFLDMPNFAKWLGTPKEALFCPGIPGAGKTMIAAITIDHLLRSVQSSSVGVAYVYCNFKAQAEQNAYSMIAAIVKQLMQARRSVVSSVEWLYRTHSDKRSKPSLEEICGVLEYLLADFSTVYVIVDALDECRDHGGARRQFLSKLESLRAGSDLRLMATSRFMPDIVNAFEKALQIEVHASVEDVRRFVIGQIPRLPTCIQRNPTLQKDVQDKIVEAVDGMFLLARLHIDSLLDKRTIKEVKVAIATFSKGSTTLDAAYKEAFQRIMGQLPGDYERAKRVLSWITYAKTPLTTTEICCALAVEPEDTELDWENVPDVEDLVSVCAGLVVVDPQSTVIRLVHYTTQEYLEHTGDNWALLAEVYITSTCLTYLSFDTFKSGSCSTPDSFKQRLQQHSFLKYAAKHWGVHAQMIEDNVCEQACKLLLNRELFSCASQVWLLDGSVHRTLQRIHWWTTNLHYAALFKLPSIMGNLLSNSAKEVMISINTMDTWEYTPLMCAALEGHSKMVKLLLDNGAEINETGGVHGSALHIASSKGHEQVAKLLIERGADVSASNEDDMTPLQIASRIGDEQVAKLLIEGGADVNASNEADLTPLLLASCIGHEQVAKLLIERGADVNASGEDGVTSLHMASYLDRELVVRLLLDQGAEVNAVSRDGFEAIFLASREGHERVLKLLLDKGADIGKIALAGASENGHEQIVKLLLDKGADPYQHNAVLLAARRGQEQIVKLLLDKGAESQYSRALCEAAGQGHVQVVKLLLNKGVDVDNGGLGAAAGRGHEQIVELLLDKGADINVGGLGAAAGRGYEHIVKLLLDRGADINKGADTNKGVLRIAASRGHEQVVKLLLDRGADVNKGALLVAAGRGHEQIVKLLLAKEAEVDDKAIQVALEGGHDRLAKLLTDTRAARNK